jgi:DNA-binding NarL/FixJ family response regulator
MVSQLAPQLVLMDLFLPDMDGYIVTSRLKALPNPPRVIVVSGHSQREFREAARNVAVDGFIPKSELVRELATLLRPATDI